MTTDLPVYHLSIATFTTPKPQDRLFVATTLTPEVQTALPHLSCQGEASIFGEPQDLVCHALAESPKSSAILVRT